MMNTMAFEEINQITEERYSICCTIAKRNMFLIKDLAIVTNSRYLNALHENNSHQTGPPQYLPKLSINYNKPRVLYLYENWQQDQMTTVMNLPTMIQRNKDCLSSILMMILHSLLPMYFIWPTTQQCTQMSITGLETTIVSLTTTSTYGRMVDIHDSISYRILMIEPFQKYSRIPIVLKLLNTSLTTNYGLPAHQTTFCMLRRSSTVHGIDYKVSLVAKPMDIYGVKYRPAGNYV